MKTGYIEGIEVEIVPPKSPPPKVHVILELAFARGLLQELDLLNLDFRHPRMKDVRTMLGQYLP